MVQATSEIMNTIAGDQGPSFERRRTTNVQNEAVAATLSIVLRGNGVRISAHPSFDSALESIEKFIGAPDL
jgi:hypothetical protein